MNLSKRIQEVSESATLAAAQKARELKSKGIDVISLTVGESDFETPEYISQAAVEAIKNHTTDHYTAVNGIIELREAIAESYVDDSVSFYTADNVFVGSGVKTALFNLFQVILNPGNEVLLPVPYWVSFAEQIKMADGKPVFVYGEESNQFKLTKKDLEDAASDQTVALVLNSPSNPSGAVYTREEMKDIGEWAVENDILIIADEIYSRLVYNGREPVSFSDLSDAIKRQSVILNGVSKTYAMTGWRIGYALGNSNLIAALTKYASQANGNPAAVSQCAALAAYRNETGEIEEMITAFENRLNKAYDEMRTIPGFHLAFKPEGAFYLFPNVKEAAQMTGYDTVDEFSLALIEQAHVVGVAGSSFGAEDFIRFSYAVDEEVFAEGMRRIKKFIEKNR
ncbi:MAG: pyridoxal phosphate-dependent aminotransferase [Atopostipes suicloacalis]|nr:pyridoxal phosphate-dependent aminotransferase [Atopostipes suicloacalis]